jgi:hypothetical protein
MMARLCGSGRELVFRRLMGDGLREAGGAHFVGGGGFGVPVVSYAPRPMFREALALRIMLGWSGLGTVSCDETKGSNTYDRQARCER